MGNNLDGMWQAVEEFRSRFEKRSGTRAGRGELRTAILALLAERPMHGYQIIREIEERSGGSWKPSAGSVYPTLQLLADEGGFVSTEESNGRKIYSLTEAAARTLQVPKQQRLGSPPATLPASAHCPSWGRACSGGGPGGAHRNAKTGAGSCDGAGRRTPSAVLDPRPGLKG